jgi:hypothetical protein
MKNRVVYDFANLCDEIDGFEKFKGEVINTETILAIVERIDIWAEVNSLRLFQILPATQNGYIFIFDELQ